MEGTLFEQYFLTVGIEATDEWRAVNAPLDLPPFQDAVREAYEALAATPGANEATTEQELIRPVLEALG